MINKELLSAVYPIDETTETYVGIQESTGRVMWFGKEYNDCRSEIDIHRVAHKCKEWALSKRYIINSGATTSNDWSSTIYKVIKENPYIKELSHTWGQSENEAIFKACQWILDKDSK